MRRLLGFVAATALMGGSIALAAPASAATVSVAIGCSGGQLTATPSSTLRAASGDQISVRNNTDGRLDVIPTGVSGNANIPAGGASATYMVTASSGSLLLFGNNTCSGSSITVNFDASASGGGGGASSSAPASAPTLETLQVGVSGSDTTCTGGNPTGFSGSWLQLPAAGDCRQTGPKADPSAKLLGWATDPNFPVAIAQRQVDNGWGAYETFNEDGQLTGVFIPAGGATFVSGSNNLYPIWSK